MALSFQYDQPYQPLSLECDKEIVLQPLTTQFIAEDYSLIKKNEKYLEQFGEGYPNINNSKQYEQYLLSIYGNFEAIAMKRFRVLYNKICVGQVGLHSFLIRNFTPTAEIFYFIDEDFQGKGIVTRAVKRILSYCFRNLELELVYIHCLKENLKSQKVAERCKFQYEGIANYYHSHTQQKEEYRRYSISTELFKNQIENQ